MGAMVNADLLDELPLPQRLAVSYAPKGSRPVTMALLALDARLSAIVRGRREPIAAQLRLAWWRERLEDDPERWPVGEPLLQALRSWRQPASLAHLPGGWEVLLADALTPPLIEEFVEARALAWHGAACELDLASPERAADAARLWAAADLAQNLSDTDERVQVLSYASHLPRPERLPASLRTLAVLAELGRAALARGGRPLLDGPRSALLALRIGMTGR